MNVHTYLGKYKLSLNGFSQLTEMTNQQLEGMYIQDKEIFDSMLRFQLGKPDNHAFGLCGCRKPVRYQVGDPQDENYACNKYARCSYALDCDKP